MDKEPKEKSYVCRSDVTPLAQNDIRHSVENSPHPDSLKITPYRTIPNTSINGPQTNDLDIRIEDFQHLPIIQPSIIYDPPDFMWLGVVPHLKRCAQDSENYGPGVSVFKFYEKGLKNSPKMNCTYKYVTKDSPFWEDIMEGLFTETPLQKYEWFKHGLVLIRKKIAKDKNDTLSANDTDIALKWIKLFDKKDYTQAL